MDNITNTQARAEIHRIAQQLEMELAQKAPREFHPDEITKAAITALGIRNSFSDYAIRQVATHISPLDLLAVGDLLRNIDDRLKTFGADISDRLLRQ